VPNVATEQGGARQDSVPNSPLSRGSLAGLSAQLATEASCSYPCSSVVYQGAPILRALSSAR